MATAQEIKTAITTALNKIAIPTNGGNYSGDLEVTGDSSYVKASEVYVGDHKVNELPIPDSSVTTEKFDDIIDLGNLS